MEVYRIDALPCTLPAARRVVALGTFDGVHLGHRQVITSGAARLRPARRGEDAPRLTVFSLCPARADRRLLSEPALVEQIRHTGAHELLLTAFDAVRDMTPDAFVTDFLRHTLHAETVVCGFNFRFGYQAAGDADLLRTLCRAQGMDVVVVDPVTDETGTVVSASRIRALLESGRMDVAQRLLGYPYTLSFPVEHGQHLGHTLGFPTINQPLPPHHVQPRFGVYASAVIVNGHVTWGVTNIGTHPTVGSGTPTAETWIQEFSGDLYGQTVPVTPVKFLRDEQTFASVDALTAQVKQDAVAAKRAVLGQTDGTDAPASYNGHPIRAVFFDFDDTLQDRYAAFLGYARWLADTYFPTLPPEEREARARWLLQENNGGYHADGSSLDYPAFFARVAARWESETLPGGDRLWQDYPYRFSSHSVLFPDSAATLRALHDRGLIVGTVTNGGSVMQLQKLDHSGIRPLLDVTVVSGVHGVHKPDPELFLRAAAYAGVAPEQCLFVGDHPQNDIDGARAAGMHPVYLDAFGKRAAHQVPRITTPGELLSLLR